MFFFLTKESLSWWGHAHSIIAGIAIDKLTSKEKEKLKNSMNFGGFPQQTIEQAATWQDELKYTYGLDGMSMWHFIQQPLFDKNFEGTANPPTYNVTTYLQSGWKTILNETTTDPTIIAFHLRSLIHFVGDAHTPHHNVAHYTYDTPTGDSGGNLYPLNCKYGGACQNIHALWDSACFAFPVSDPSLPVYISEFSSNVTKYIKKHKESSYGSKDLKTVDIMGWRDESFSIVSEYGYTTPQNEEPSQEYITKCRELSIDRVMLAGYRLGNMLRTIIDTRGLPGEADSASVREIVIWCINAALFVLSCFLFFKGKQNTSPKYRNI